MNTLEEYSTFATTIIDLMRDGEEISMIETIQSSLKDAKRVYEEERNQFQSEIDKLLQRVETSQKQMKRVTSKEEHDKRMECLEQDHQRTLKNITRLQEERLRLQSEIKQLQQSPSLVEKQKQLQQLHEKYELEEQKVRLFMNTFKRLNWDFESQGTQGYVITPKGKVKHFRISSGQDETCACNNADALWDLL